MTCCTSGMAFRLRGDRIACGTVQRFGPAVPSAAARLTAIMPTQLPVTHFLTHI